MDRLINYKGYMTLILADQYLQLTLVDHNFEAALQRWQKITKAISPAVKQNMI